MAPLELISYIIVDLAANGGPDRCSSVAGDRPNLERLFGSNIFLICMILLSNAVRTRRSLPPPTLPYCVSVCVCVCLCHNSAQETCWHQQPAVWPLILNWLCFPCGLWSSCVARHPCAQLSLLPLPLFPSQATHLWPSCADTWIESKLVISNSYETPATRQQLRSLGSTWKRICWQNRIGKSVSGLRGTTLPLVYGYLKAPQVAASCSKLSPVKLPSW